MDLQSNARYESSRMEQIVLQFFSKSLHVILNSRIPSIRQHVHGGELSSVPTVKKSDKWFNLVLGDRPAALDNLNIWHKNLMDSMIIDIILVHKGPDSSPAHHPLTTGTSVETVIERWAVRYESVQIMVPLVVEPSASYKKTYKKSIIFLRSLHSTMRLLPAYKIFQRLNTSRQSCDFDIIYKVSSFSDPFSSAEEEIMKQYSFVPIEALPGRLYVSVMYRPVLSDFNLEPLKSLPPRIITDYVGSPGTDPSRVFSCYEKDFHPTSFPVRGIQSPLSTPFQRPHSWTSGLHPAAPFTQNQPLSYSPPSCRLSSVPSDYLSPSPDIYGHRIQNYRPPTFQRAASFDDYQLSPPFSPSPSPSPPSYFFSGDMRTRLQSETAPVTIPLPMMGRSPKYLSPNSSDPNRHYLPPLSPKSAKHDLSLQGSPSGNRSFRKTEVSRTGEPYCLITNHCSGQKVFKDSKDDSGRFSGLLSSSGSPRIGFSRSSSRLSFQDDMDDSDFSCPFVVDDVDTPDFQSRHHIDGETSHPFPVARKSQDAAVGALVHMLRTAPPLRQDSSCYSSHSLKPELEGEVGASGFLMPRKAADALEELRSYREMKDLLFSKSGTQVGCSEET